MLITLDPSLKPNRSIPMTKVDQMADQMSDRQRRGRISVQSLFPVAHALQGRHHHVGIMAYYGTCWRNHLTAVVDPDILWQLVMGEVAAAIKAEPERYRELFTTTQEKQQIVVSGHPRDPSFISDIVRMLEKVVPSETKHFLPEFSTTTKRSRMAHQAMFCEAMSPFYDYSMFLCGLHSVDVRGTAEDWERAARCCVEIAGLMTGEGKYLLNVANLFDNVALTVSGVDKSPDVLWRNFFNMEKCGSGSQHTVFGWVTRLFRNPPDLAKVENFPSGVARVDFRDLSDGAKPYQVMVGVLSSELEGDTLEPKWGHILYEKREPVTTEGYAASSSDMETISVGAD